MKPISARPQSISEFFSGSSYEIPGYQRRYQWEIEQCEQMWDDFTDFNETKKSGDKYFLGAIVIEKTIDEKVFNIVDGQQRAITIMLLLAAIFSKANTHKRLEKVIKKVDSRSTEVTNELRLKTNVIEDDAKSLTDIIFGRNKKLPNDNKFNKNYKFFEAKASDWIENNGNTDRVDEFIENILDHVLLLPIECESTDDALVLFNTLNNRGLQLSDADIFKAKIYALIKDEKGKEIFLSRWNEILNSYDDHHGEMTDLFRIHMHVDRAKHGIISKEIALRTYYEETKSLTYPETIDSIELYSSFNTWEGTSTINIIYSILQAHNNHYWKYPIYTYLAIKSKSASAIDIEPKEVNDYERLMEEVLKYILIKGVVWNSVNKVKDFIFKLCADIAKEMDMPKIIKKIQKEYKTDVEEFTQKLHHPLEKRYTRTIVMTLAYLDAKSKEESLNKLSEFILTSKFDVEHILPKKWNDYDGWTNESHAEHLNNVGNLVLLDKPLNIAAKCEFFTRKKGKYKKSEISAAIKLARHKSDNWTKEEVIQRNKEMIKLFEDFIS